MQRATAISTAQSVLQGNTDRTKALVQADNAILVPQVPLRIEPVRICVWSALIRTTAR